MSASVTTIQTPKTYVLPAEKQPDEVVWQAWLAKGRAPSRRTHASLMKVVKWISIGALVAAAGNWLHPAPYTIVVRFVVTGGAVVLMSEALYAHHYVVSAAFGALVLLYNPAAPLFAFAGDWQHAVVGEQRPVRRIRRLAEFED